MKITGLDKLKRFLLIAALFAAAANSSVAQTRGGADRGKRGAAAESKRAQNADAPVKERHVRAQMEFLASDALAGRGSGTEFERLAAHYIAAQLQQFGVAPAGDSDAATNVQTYVQTVNITRQTFSETPTLTYAGSGGAPVVLEHGKEMLVARLNQANIGGALRKIASDEKPPAGAVVFVRRQAGEDGANALRGAQTMLGSGAAAVIVEETPALRQQWETIAARPISFTRIASGAMAEKSNAAGIVVVSSQAASALAQIADGTAIEIKGALGAAQTRQTWNAVGKIEGVDRRLKSDVILLSAHLDHLGVRENAAGADKIYNGADDDASGCVAVLELARVLASGAVPKRTVYFAFYGSEEAGGYGSQHFVNTLPFPRENIRANLQFEMIGRPDPKVAAEELWLTGYDRSNLGAELAKRGAKLVADPHPQQNFFQRSDNYTLARQGVVAHIVSSFGLHQDYHQATDETKTIDFKHLTRAVNSMVKPVEWLVNSDFKPIWAAGKKP